MTQKNSDNHPEAVQLFDTHCHIHEMERRITPVYDRWHDDKTDNERTPESVITTAHEAGVMRMVCIGTTREDSEQAISFVRGRENLWATIGIHPHEAARHNSTEEKKEFAALLKGSIETNKIVGIGECGLDYFYDHSPREDQIAMLKFQIELALEHDLPLSFHVREAFDDFWPIFESYRGSDLRGVLHSFTDTAVNLEKAVEQGLHFGVNGIVTFTKDEAQRVIYRTIPQRLLLMETDAPFLTPVPFRGKVCEPRHVRVTAQFLADLRSENLEDLAVATTANARALFKV